MRKRTINDNDKGTVKHKCRKDQSEYQVRYICWVIREYDEASNIIDVAEASLHET